MLHSQLTKTNTQYPRPAGSEPGEKDNMRQIKNRNQIIQEFADMLMQFDIDMNQYQTDVYLYLAEDGTATLEEFVNVGGNSWRDDDHYTLYTDMEHYEAPEYIFESDLDIGLYWMNLNLSVDQLRKETATDMGLDPEDIETCDIWKYIQKHYEKEFNAAQKEAISTGWPESYTICAEEILSDFEKSYPILE